MGVLGGSFSGAALARDDGGVVAKLGAAGNDVDSPHHFCGSIAVAQHLKRKLRHTIAKILQRQSLKHDVGQTAIRGCIDGALNRLDETVRALCFAARIEPRREARYVDQFSIGPDFAKAINLAFTKPNRQICIVTVCCGFGRWPAFR